MGRVDEDSNEPAFADCHPRPAGVVDFKQLTARLGWQGQFVEGENVNADVLRVPHGI
jgi:hypothetical protein